MTWLGGLKVSVQLGFVFNARPEVFLIYPLQIYFYKNKHGTRFA